jgi:hypothetical protein
MTTTITTYEPFPELAPRTASETPEQYGLRALLFCTAQRQTVTVDDDGLQLADHYYGVAVGGRDLSPAAAEKLAGIREMIQAAIARRAASDSARLATLAASAASTPAGEDKPNLGPMAPLSPVPVAPVAPTAVQPVPVAVPVPVPVPVTGPAAIPARYTAISPAIAARATVPQVPADRWGF